MSCTAARLIAATPTPARSARPISPPALTADRRGALAGTPDARGQSMAAPITASTTKTVISPTPTSNRVTTAAKLPGPPGPGPAGPAPPGWPAPPAGAAVPGVTAPVPGVPPV